MKEDKFTSSTGGLLTEALFLERGYRTEFAIYTLKEYDYTYKGKLYPSIKRLYLEMEDVGEYDFATKYFYSWKHWQRIKDNAALKEYVEEWSTELEVKMRSQAIRDIVNITADGAQGSFQAAKWLADRGWDKRAPGRPSKSEKDKDDAIDKKISDEFMADVVRMRR